MTSAPPKPTTPALSPVIPALSPVIPAKAGTSAAGRRDLHSPPRGPSEPPPNNPADPPPNSPAEEHPIRQHLERLERGLQHVESRIDRLYIAVGGGTILLAAIGLAAGFIARGS